MPSIETGNFPNHWPAASSWSKHLQREFEKPYFLKLLEFVSLERESFQIFPAAEHVFRAFELTRFEDTRVVILGQDPYHGPGQAQGLSFSVPQGTTIPPSLRNIFKERFSDLKVPPPAHGDLAGWARQGVLLLNTVLTVRHGEAHSHRDRGWEIFSDQVIKCLGQRGQPTVFVLWGKPAGKKKDLIDTQRHLVIESAHPSPLSASRGFLGSKPFSKINFFLSQNSLPLIDWARDKNF